MAGASWGRQMEDNTTLQSETGCKRPAAPGPTAAFDLYPKAVSPLPPGMEQSSARAARLPVGTRHTMFLRLPELPWFGGRANLRLSPEVAVT